MIKFETIQFKDGTYLKTYQHNPKTHHISFTTTKKPDNALQLSPTGSTVKYLCGVMATIVVKGDNYDN